MLRVQDLKGVGGLEFQDFRGLDGLKVYRFPGGLICREAFVLFCTRNRRLSNFGYFGVGCFWCVARVLEHACLS